MNYLKPVLAILLLSAATFSTALAQGRATHLDVLIGFKSPPTDKDLALVKAAKGQVKRIFNIIPSVAATIPAAALEGLQRNPRISIIEEDGQFFADDHNTGTLSFEYNNTWGVKHIGAALSHNLGFAGATIKVAVLDSGLDYLHPDLTDRYVPGYGYDFINNDFDPMDDNDHGTHVAGTIAAVQNGAGVIGVAPQVQIFPLKVLGANGSGSYSAVIAALDWCTRNGIHISNSSLGSSRDPGTQVRAAYDNSARTYNILHIASAGNSGNPGGKGDSVGFPAKYDSVVAVAAVDQNNRRASFSSTGPKVELAAPGVGIRSTVVGGSYADYNGTSMASPHVAGVAALIWNKLGSGANKDTVRAYLRQTAVDLGTGGRDYFYGFGLVQAPR